MLNSCDYFNSLSDVRINDYKVLALCLTYNHSKYITDTFNGFALQQTNFPFVCLIIDDASTNGEVDVIKQWLDSECTSRIVAFEDPNIKELIISKHRSNVNCSFVIYFLRNNLFKQPEMKFKYVYQWAVMSKYLALCEGDDYWTKPGKLQSQFDALELHPEIDMCVHAYSISDARTGISSRCHQCPEKDYLYSVKDVVLFDGSIATSSILVRLHILAAEWPEFLKYYFNDYSFLIYSAMRGGILYICENMSVYRINVKDSWCYKAKNDETFRLLCEKKRHMMLGTFDKETNYKYHSIVQGRMLLETISAHKSRKENQSFFSLYKEGLNILPINKKISILCKCVFPEKLCVLIASICSRLYNLNQ